MSASSIPLRNSPSIQECLLYSDIFHAHFQYDCNHELALATTFLEQSLKSSCRVRWKDSSLVPKIISSPNIVNNQRHQSVQVSIRFPFRLLQIGKFMLIDHPFIMNDSYKNSNYQKLQEFTDLSTIPVGTTFSIRSHETKPSIFLERHLIAEDAYSTLEITLSTSDHQETENDITILPRGGRETVSFVIRSSSQNAINILFQWTLTKEINPRTPTTLFPQKASHTNSSLPKNIAKFLYVDQAFYAGSPYTTHIEHKDMLWFIALTTPVLSEGVVTRAIDSLLKHTSEKGFLSERYLDHTEAPIWHIIHNPNALQQDALSKKPIHLNENDSLVLVFPLVLLYLFTNDPSLLSLNSIEYISPSSRLSLILRILEIVSKQFLKSSIHLFPECLFTHSQYDPTTIPYANYPSSINVHIFPALLFYLDKWCHSLRESSAYKKIALFCKTYSMGCIAELISSQKTAVLFTQWINIIHHFEVLIPCSEISHCISIFFQSSRLNPEENNFFQTQTLEGMSFTQILQKRIKRKTPIHFFAKSLDLRTKKIPIMTSTFCYTLYFLDMDAFDIGLCCDLMELPYPIGLRTPIGIICENVSYAKEESIIAKETSPGGLARTFYVWQQCMILHGLYRYRKRTVRTAELSNLMDRINKIYTWLYETIFSLPITCNTYTFTCENGVMEAVPAESRSHDSISLLYSTIASLEDLPTNLR